VVGAAGSRVLHALALAAALGVTPPAGAAEARTFTLAYAAPEGCPARATFVASIHARAAESREVELAGDLAFDVLLEPAAELTRGLLSVRFSGGERFEREVPPGRCGDVATTLSIMAGLLLSGALLPEAAAPPPETPAPPEPAPPSPAPAPPPAPSVASPVVAPKAPGAPLGRFRAGVAVHGELELGALPFPALGGSVGLDIALERESVFAPSLRAGFAYLTARATHPPQGDAQFTLRALFVRVCPLRFELSTPLVLTACALLDTGSLAVAGRSTTLPEDVSMTWTALGPAARLSARLSSVLTLEAEARGQALLRHDRFVLQPGSVEVHEVSAFSGALGLGILAQLP
jgi:hypothetical protein